MRGPGPGGAAPQREMNAPRATQSDQRPRVDRPARGPEGPPRGIERNRQAEPQQRSRDGQRAAERERDRAVRSDQGRNVERERNAERARAERSGAGPSTENGPNSVATRNVSAMPSELARQSVSAPTVSRSKLRNVSGGKQSSPACGASASGRQATASRVESA